MRSIIPEKVENMSSHLKTSRSSLIFCNFSQKKNFPPTKVSAMVNIDFVNPSLQKQKLPIGLE